MVSSLLAPCIRPSAVSAWQLTSSSRSGASVSVTPWRLTRFLAFHAYALQGVWPPSNWDPRLAERSATLPDVRLALEFVHGYDGWAGMREWQTLPYAAVQNDCRGASTGVVT